MSIHANFQVSKADYCKNATAKMNIFHDRNKNNATVAFFEYM